MMPFHRLGAFSAKRHLLSTTIACLVIGGQLASAAQVFNNRTNFLNATGPLFSEGFEGLPANNNTNLVSVVTNDFTVTSSNNELGIFNIPLAGSAATEGANALVHQSGANVTTTFTFDFPIDSFGFDLLDYGDFGTGQLRLTNNAGDNVVVAVAGAADGNVQYFGVISDFLFTQAVLTNTIAGEAFGFDRMSYGTGVPEPSVLVLLAIGYAGIAGCTRRRRTAA